MSPHLDDAVLSCGASLFNHINLGGSATVYTVFAGKPNGAVSPVAQAYHRRWQVLDAVESRRLEDRQALNTLGATAVHGPFLDSIYRRRPDGGWLVQGTEYASDLPLSPERDLVALISHSIRRMITELEPAEVWTCAGIGGHIDHLTTRNAVIAAVEQTSGSLVRLWEDYPYSRFSSRALPTLPPQATVHHEMVLEPDDRAWQSKLAAAICYQSQWETVREYFAADGAEAAEPSCIGRSHGQERSWWVGYETDVDPRPFTKRQD